ncbi:uncharacterized protein LOC134517559 isoform X3 [Chroicocephalus ridibundus]|uniref:uncharacterized protein LOC134517559 isoform X3 n=1 Tax=Chroicocephalus ridibundus TaxID=1192867 RepID=UPI002FDE6AA2
MLTEMGSSSSLVVFLLLMCSINGSSPFSYSVFMRRDEAHEVLKVHKRANYFLEEIRPGNLERECNEEKCSFEEAKEIFHSQEKTMEFWFNYKGLNPCSTNPCKNGGVCKIRHYSYFCICPPRFGGDNCEKEQFECWYKNGGCWQYCRDGSAWRAACSCAPGYSLQEDGKSCLPAAPFPCGLIKARQALEEARLGQNRLPRGRREHGAEAAEWNQSTEWTLGQMELEQSNTGENETVFGQSTRTERDTEVAGDASSWNKMLADAVTREPLGDGAAGREAGVPEHEEPLEGTGWPGSSPAPWGEPTRGPAWPSETTVPAARRQERVENAAGQNQTTRDDGLHGSSDWGNVSAVPQFAQTNVSSTLEQNGARITGGTLCHRGHCPWQVLIRNSRDIGFCGGSLISSRWVVTAAHCLDLVRPHHVTIAAPSRTPLCRVVYHSSGKGKPLQQECCNKHNPVLDTSRKERWERSKENTVLGNCQETVLQPYPGCIVTLVLRPRGGKHKVPWKLRQTLQNTVLAKSNDRIYGKIPAAEAIISVSICLSSQPLCFALKG